MDPLLPDLNQAIDSVEQARVQRMRQTLPVSGRDEASANPNDRPFNDLAGLKRVAKQFESIFYGQLIKSMRASVPENGFWGQGGGTKIYQQMHDQALADDLAGKGGLGIGNLIVRQLAHTVPGGENDGQPTIGPPTPITPPPRAPGIQAYLRQGQTGDRIARMVRLRHQAEAMGGAAADSLDRYQREISSAAEANDLDPALVLAVVVRESGGDAQAVSARGAQGLMQLMPATARELGVDDPADPAQNLQGGATYLARMLRRYEGDVDLALAAYNAGPGTVDRAGRRVPDYPETRAYVAAVKRLAAQLGANVGTELDKDSPQERP